MSGRRQSVFPAAAFHRCSPPSAAPIRFLLSTHTGCWGGSRDSTEPVGRMHAVPPASLAALLITSHRRPCSFPKMRVLNNKNGTLAYNRCSQCDQTELNCKVGGWAGCKEGVGRGCEYSAICGLGVGSPDAVHCTRPTPPIAPVLPQDMKSCAPGTNGALDGCTACKAGFFVDKENAVAVKYIGTDGNPTTKGYYGCKYVAAAGVAQPSGAALLATAMASCLAVNSNVGAVASRSFVVLGTAASCSATTDRTHPLGASLGAGHASQHSVATRRNRHATLVSG